MKATRFVLFAALTVAGCRTGDDKADLQSGPPPGALGMPAPSGGTLWAELSEGPAQAMYEAFHTEEQTDQVGGRKAFTGDLVIDCSREGFGGSIPNGAQGIVAPAVFNCRIFVPMHFPAGAQGLPAPAMVTLDGDAARSFYGSFKAAESVQSGTGRKTFTGAATVACNYANFDGAHSGYHCTVRADGAGSGSDDGGGAPQPKTLLSLTGADAKSVYTALKLPEVVKPGGGSKSRGGQTDLVCTRKGFGGSIPNGAQGIVAPAKFDCTIRAGQSMPAGVQGLPAPAKVILTLKNAIAGAVYNALTVQETLVAAKGTKEYSGDVTMECHYALVSGGKKNYSCSWVMPGSGGSDDNGSLVCKGTPSQPSITVASETQPTTLNIAAGNATQGLSMLCKRIPASTGPVIADGIQNLWKCLPNLAPGVDSKYHVSIHTRGFVAGIVADVFKGSVKVAEVNCEDGGAAGGSAGGSVSGYDLNGPKSCAPLADGMACAQSSATDQQIVDKCLAIGAQTKYCSDCSEVCDQPLSN